MDELIPCPFCGLTDLYVVQAQIEEYHSVEPEISCKECGYTIKLKNTAIAVDESPETNAEWWNSDIAKKWNRRPAEDALTAEVERLKAEIDRIKMLIVLRRNFILKRMIEYNAHEFITECNTLNLLIEAINNPVKESEGEDE